MSFLLKEFSFFFFANNSALLEDVDIIENLLCMCVGVCVCS